MTRIFFTLAFFSLTLVTATLLLGLTMGELGRAADDATRLHFRVHFLTGLGAALAVVFVNSIVVTYFIGTSRWCKEVAVTYELDPSIIARSNTLKRRTFPWALANMLVIIVVIALGAAADPGALLDNPKLWATVHLYAALVGTAFLGWSYYVQWGNIEANHRLIAEIMASVRQIRQERGLQV